MKRMILILQGLILTFIASGQLLLNENFTSYSPGNLGSQGSWVPNGSGNDAQVTGTNLIYPNYPSGGQSLSVAAVNGIDPHKLFSAAISTTAASTFYVSFVVQASNAAVAGSAEYSLVLRNSGNISYLSRFFLIKNASNNLEFGISKGSATVGAATTGDYHFNTPYLIIIRYDVSPGGSNDAMYLWVNPALESEPDIVNANLVINSGSDPSYGAAIDALMIHQRSTNSPVAIYDGLRVANGNTHMACWTNLNPQGSALPVLIERFQAASESEGIALSWTVAAEKDVLMYVVERSRDGMSFIKAGQVSAAGKPQYSYEDRNCEESNFYRLKIIDIDGSTDYSHIIHIRHAGESEMAVYPNPVRSTMTINLHERFVGGQLEIFDEAGRQVSALHIGSGKMELDCSKLTRGIYFVSARNGLAMKWKMVVRE